MRTKNYAKYRRTSEIYIDFAKSLYKFFKTQSPQLKTLYGFDCNFFERQFEFK